MPQHPGGEVTDPDLSETDREELKRLVDAVGQSGHAAVQLMYRTGQVVTSQLLVRGMQLIVMAYQRVEKAERG